MFTHILFSDSILNGMKSKDPSVVANATQRADMFLHNTEGTTTFNADGLRVKTNKTIINKKAFESNPTQNDAMSPGKTTGILILIIALCYAYILLSTDHKIDNSTTAITR
jgi:hypothetical protein